MPMTSIGDLAQSLVLKHRGAALKTDIAMRTQELATGRVADVTGRLNGDYAYLADIDNRLARLDSFAHVTAETRLFADTAQTALAQLQDSAAALGSDLLTTVPTTIATLLDQAAGRARRDLDSMITQLNASVAGQSLFAGTATDRAPLAAADTLLTALRPAIAGAATVADIRQAAEAWFADPVGFASQVYQGADTALAPVPLEPGQQVELPLRADDPVLRATLMELALVALSDDPALGYDLTTRNALLRASGEALLSGQSGLSGLHAGLGEAQARIDAATARIQAEHSALTLARATLLKADPYETAVRLEDAQFRLESLYAATARNAQLSLVRFLS